MYDQLINFLVENGERFSHEDRNGHIDSSTKIADHLSNLRDDYLKLIDNALQQGEKFIELKNYKTENNDNVIKLMQDQESITLADACGDEEILIEIFKKLLVDDYSPPSHNLLELYLHLFCAWLYFEIIKKINDLPLPMVMHMNYVSLRIITVVSFSLGLGPGINKKMNQRYKSLKPRIERAEQIKQEVWQYIKSKPATWLEGRSLSNIATLTQKDLAKKGIKRSDKQIKTYISEGIDLEQFKSTPHESHLRNLF